MSPLTTFSFNRTRLNRALQYTVTCIDDEGNRLYAFPIPQATLSLEVATQYLRRVDHDRCPMVDSIEYPHGSTILFGDCTATVPVEEIGETLMMVEGIVTGLPIQTATGVSIPVAAPRAGRTDGIIYIDSSNVISVEKPHIRDIVDGIFYE